MDRLSRVNRESRLNAIIRHTHERTYYKREHMAIDRLSRTEFIQIHRLSPETFSRLTELLENNLRRPTLRSQCLSASEQVEMALKFYACGTFQSVIGFSSQVKQATVSRVVTRVTDAILENSNHLISWPSIEEQKTQSRLFQQQRQLPNVIGCVDGTHIRLKYRPRIHEEAYINRKQFHSINAMITCDADLRVINLDAR